MFHHHRSSVSQGRVEINQHHHQEEESMVVASSSAAHHHHHHHHMGFNINPSLPPLTSPSSSLIPNCFGAHQLDSILGSGSDQAAAASSSSPPNLKRASDDHVQLPASSSPAQISTTVNPWAWSTAEEGALLLSKKKELGESNNANCDPKNKKKKKTSDSNSDNTGARRNMMVVVMMKEKKVMNKAGTRKKVREPRFCFKTMSEVDVLDDGYKWRKYGQKVVKNTQHPRSYYRCTQDNCRVKKRIERLAEDPRMVITTYEGRHVHSPSHDQDQSQSSSSKFNLFW